MPPLLLVMAGGAVGAGLRYEIGHVLSSRLGHGWPWSTWCINIIGALLLGLLLGASSRFGGESDPLRLLLGVGVLGGFTTFSAFSAETVALLQQGAAGTAAAYALSSVAGGVLLLVVGIWLGRVLA